MAAILLVEDVPTVRTVLRAFLEFAGHEVTECAGGEEATRLMKHHSFQVVVTDLRMKDGDGLGFIRDQRSKGATIPIIAMTGGDPALVSVQGRHSCDPRRRPMAGQRETHMVAHDFFRKREVCSTANSGSTVSGSAWSRSARWPAASPTSSTTCFNRSWA